MSNTLFDDDTSDDGDRQPHPLSKLYRDQIWDALAVWFGEPRTVTEKRLRGKILNSLVGAEATPQEVHDRCRAWADHFPGAVLTVTALEKHWTQLGRSPLRDSGAKQIGNDLQRRRHRDCPVCGGEGVLSEYAPGAGMIVRDCPGA